MGDLGRDLDIDNLINDGSFDDLFPIELLSSSSTGACGMDDLENPCPDFSFLDELFVDGAEEPFSAAAAAASATEFGSAADDNSHASSNSTQDEAPQQNPGSNVPDQDPISATESKRQLRLMKNREAASMSRQRKKSYIKSLESKCRMWENTCKALERSVTFLCSENATLRNELLRCKRPRDGNEVMEPAVLKDSLPSESPSLLTVLVVFFLVTSMHCLLTPPTVLIFLVLGEIRRPIEGKDIKHGENKYVLPNCHLFFCINGETPVLDAFPVKKIKAFPSCRRPSDCVHSHLF